MIGIGFAAGMSAAQKALRVAIAVIALGALLALSYCQGRIDGKAAVRLDQAQADLKHMGKAAKAGEQAAETRLADERRNREVELNNEKAIAAAPGGRNSPAAVALACERLRRAGITGADLPIECRSQGGQ